MTAVENRFVVVGTERCHSIWQSLVVTETLSTAALLKVIRSETVRCPYGYAKIVVVPYDIVALDEDTLVVGVRRVEGRAPRQMRLKSEFLVFLFSQSCLSYLANIASDTWQPQERDGC